MNEANPVTAYKTLLASIIDRRPSGTRQRLADALAKNRSFVTQITNPAYATPVPASHLDVIFEICHFSPVHSSRLRVMASGTSLGRPLAASNVAVPPVDSRRTPRACKAAAPGIHVHAFSITAHILAVTMVAV